MVYLLTAAFAVLVFFQVSGTAKKKQYKELVISLVVLTIALLYGYAEIMDWVLPSPGGLIDAIYKPISRLVFDELLK